MLQCVLITGGIGYVGSHLTKLLLENNYKVIIIDNLSNASEKTLNKLESLSNNKLKIYLKDLKEEINYIRDDIDIVFHLAALKSVSKSVVKPLDYYENNLFSTIQVLKFIKSKQITKLIFSSSAAVYGSNNKVPIKEKDETSPINPYGESKLINEKIINDFTFSNAYLKSISLRYFNPIGSEKSHILSDAPLGKPENLMSIICNCAKNKSPIDIFGNDYDTPDGTCIRDFVHISDIVEAHLQAAEKIDIIQNHKIFNLGLGKGISVMDIIKIFEKTNKQIIDVNYKSRRSGDVDKLFADVSQAYEKLNWRPKKNYEDMCFDSWQAYLKNT